MPEAFKDKYLKRVIIDCTEIKCEIPSSLLLNSEQYSSYKNHTALEGLISIAVFEPERELATFSPLSDDLSLKI